MKIVDRDVVLAFLKGQPPQLQQGDARQRMVESVGGEQRLCQLGHRLRKLVGRGIRQAELQLDPALRPVIRRAGATDQRIDKLRGQRIVFARRPQQLAAARQGQRRAAHDLAGIDRMKAWRRDDSARLQHGRCCRVAPESWDTSRENRRPIVRSRARAPGRGNLEVRLRTDVGRKIDPQHPDRG